MELAAFTIEELRAVLHQNLRVKADMTPEEWAEEVYRLPTGARFRFSYAPYTREMFRSLFDPRAIDTTYRLYSRGIKSTLILLAIGYVIDQAPRRILALWPTNNQGEKWSKDILGGELFDTTEPLNYLGTKSGQRKTSNTILHKNFPGGLIDIFGANAPGDMRRAKGSFLYADEIDAIAATQTDEGDQMVIFNKRGDEYPDTIRAYASYPSVKGLSRIDSKIEKSDENQWLSTCVRCGGEPFQMHRLMIRYDKGKTEDARFECPRCHAFLTDLERYEMAHGQGFDLWTPKREFRGHRGFVGNAMLWPHPVDSQKYPGGLIQKLAEDTIAAEESENPRRAMRVIINTVDAESFDPTSEEDLPPEWEKVRDSVEDYGLTIPENAFFITAFVDVQLNRLEVEWKAWGRQEESWAMDHVTIDGAVRKPEVWEKLRFELAREWVHAWGPKMRLGFGMVDGGYYAEDVYRFFRDLAERKTEHVYGKVRASKGVGQFGHPVVQHKMMTVAKNLKGHHIGTWEAKDRIYGRLKQPRETVLGRMHYNKRFTEEFFRQLCVEKATIEYIGADEVKKFENEKRDRNEALDLEVGNLAAFKLRNRNFDALEAELKQQASDLKAEKPKEQRKVRSGDKPAFMMQF